ncbi:WD40 associated region in TFIID subunit, NTD2 domain [Dermatophagoides farinae]|uniref:WD40 associated region in TFIID subunit, NTD2 domain n=1 Tax=Dermatophagoides farinae TaxID=6954 RepID=A0A922LDR1_DERFA|nr:WD40 associated region in TFIID subunit, NTD2 domain [Dermatophagoides farinae]
MACKVVDDDTIQKIVSNYIKHRNYKANSRVNDNHHSLTDQQSEENGTETTLRDDNVLPAKDWFLEGALSAFQSIRNVATLRLKEEDFVKEVEVAFRKFVEFINNIRLTQIEENLKTSSTSSSSSWNQKRMPQQHGEELWMTCFPLFVHIFIQLFECGHVANAQNFFIEHYQRFTKKSNHVQFLSSMQSSLNNNSLNSALQNFKNFKCRIMITEQSFNLLTQFLKHEQHLSILQTFNSCLDFRVMTQEEYSNQQTYQGVSAQNDSVHQDDILAENLANPNNSEEMNEILNIIKSVRDMDDEENDDDNNEPSDLNYPTQAYQTTVCLCRMQSANTSSVAISKNLAKIVAGTENSEILLWDCDLTDELEYFSSRLYRHWKRVPVRQITSEVDFKFINPKTCDDKSVTDDDDDDDDDDDEKDDFKNQVNPIIFRGHSNTVYEMSFLFDSNLLLSCSSDTTIRAWDVNSSSCLAVYKGHASAIWTIDSNDSGCFISGGRDGIAHMWDIERTVPMRIYSGHLMDINQIKFHPNCNYLATASADKTIILWDVNQVRQVRMFCGHTASVNAIRFSSCGKYLASASEDGSVKIWDISQGRCIAEMLDHQDDIRCITFGPNDHLLASCGIGSSAVHIWENSIACAKSQQSVPFIAIDVNSSNSSSNGNGRENESESMTTNINTSQNCLMQLQFIRHNVLLAFSKKKLDPNNVFETKFMNNSRLDF